MKIDSLKKVGAGLLSISLASATLLSPIAQAANKVKLKEASRIYFSADAVKSGSNPAGVYSKGEYFVFKEFGDFVNISRVEGVPGGWLSKSQIEDEVKSVMQVSDTVKVSNKTSDTKVEDGKIKIVNSVKIYLSADDAKFNRNVRGTYSAGTYYVYRQYNGAINISKTKGQPGGWIYLENSKEVELPKVQVSTKNEVKKTENIVVEENGTYILDSSKSGYMSADDAKNSRNRTTTLSSGKYYIYKAYNGMLNLSKSKNTPGAWVNPDETVVVKEVNNSLNVLVKESISNNLAEKVIEFGDKYLGYNYVYGKSNPSVGFDCSGFTKFVFSQVGITLPHQSRAQSNLGKYVAKSDLQVGDLVFFGANNYITHVAIYAGNGLILHAQNESTGVTYSSLSSNYYTNNYITARRVLN